MTIRGGLETKHTEKKGAGCCRNLLCVLSHWFRYAALCRDVVPCFSANWFLHCTSSVHSFRRKVSSPNCAAMLVCEMMSFCTCICSCRWIQHVKVYTKVHVNGLWKKLCLFVCECMFCVCLCKFGSWLSLLKKSLFSP